MCAQLLSRIQLFATPWTGAHQAYSIKEDIIVQKTHNSVTH